MIPQYNGELRWEQFLSNAKFPKRWFFYFYFEGFVEDDSALTASSNFAFPWCKRISSSSNPRSAIPLSQRNFAAHSIALLGSRSCLEISSSLCHAPSTSRIQTYQRSMGFAPTMLAEIGRAHV